MRPLEALLAGADVAAVMALVLTPWLRRWTLLFTLPPVLIALVQVGVEGWRWQLLPAEALALVVFLIAPKPGPAPSVRRLKRPYRNAAAAVCAGAACLVMAIALPLALPVFAFPTPSGPYAIGTVSYDWVDEGRREIFSSDPSVRREVMVQIWYPAKPDASAPRAPYLDDPAALAPLERLLLMPPALFAYLKYVSTNAVVGAPIVDGGGRFPVLIFAHGRGGYRQHNTFQVEELVSHGYVVAAIDQPYAASAVRFADGRRVAFDARFMDQAFLRRAIPYLAGDVSFVLDQLSGLNGNDPGHRFANRLDLGRAGVFGLSMGGMVAAEACHRDARLRACLPMDVEMPADVVRAGLVQPTMWISRDADSMQMEGWKEADVAATQSTMNAVYASLPGDGYRVLEPGMFHQNFSDLPLALPPPLGRWVGLIGPVDPRRGLAIVDAYSLAFFDHELKGRPEPLLDGRLRPWPEVQFSSRRGRSE